MWEKVRRYTDKKLDVNLQIVEQEGQYIPKACALKYYPLVVQEALGAIVKDVDGNEFIDFLTSAAVYNIGHRHPKVVAAAKTNGSSYKLHNGLSLRKQPIELAKAGRSDPGRFHQKVTFGFSGSDGVDSAIKAARAYTGRHAIMSFEHSYHGMTYGALSATGIVDPDIRKRMGTLDVKFVEFPDPYRNSYGIDGYEYPDELCRKALDAIDKAISSLSERPACIIVEPIQGDAGAIIPPEKFLKGLKELTENYGIIFIDEEVQVGMGRTGKLWAIEHFDVEPDMFVTAKALGGGFPISTTVGKAEIMDSVPQPLFVFTHIGHAVNASAALAAIEVVEDEKLPEQAMNKGRKVVEQFMEMSRRYSIIGDVRGIGLLVGVDIVKPGTKEPDKDTAQKICWRAWEKGLILITFGKHGNVLRVAPSLNIPTDQLNQAMTIIDEAVEDVLQGKVSDDVLQFMRGW